MNRILYIQLSTLFFLQMFIWGSWYVTTGTFLLQTAGFSGREVGLVYTTTALAATLSPFLLGILADQLFSTERLLALLHGSGGLLMLGISFIDEFAVFFPVLVLYALLYMPTFALTSALCFHNLRDGAREFPKVRVWGTIGWIIAGLAISFFDLEPTPVPMRISAITSFLTAAYCLTLPHTPPQPKVGKRSLKDFLGPDVLRLLKRPSFAVLIISLILISIPSGFYYTFTNSFLTEIGVENPAGKMTVGQMSEVVLMLFMPFFFSRLGFKWVIAVGLFAWGARYALFAWGDAGPLVWMLWLGILLHGVAFNFTALTGQIYIDQIVPKHVRSTAQGFMSMATLGFGALLGAYIAGEVVEHFTVAQQQHLWRSIWMVPATIGLVVTVGFILFFKEKTED